MALISLNSIVIPAAALIVLLFATQVVSYQKPAYGCLDGRSEWKWIGRTELFSYNGFKIAGYKLIYECDEQYRFDRKTGVMCGSRCSISTSGKESRN